MMRVFLCATCLLAHPAQAGVADGGGPAAPPPRFDGSATRAASAAVDGAAVATQKDWSWLVPLGLMEAVREAVGGSDHPLPRDHWR